MSDNPATPAAMVLAGAAAEAAAFGISLPGPVADPLGGMVPGGKSARELLGLAPEAGHGARATAAPKSEEAPAALAGPKLRLRKASGIKLRPVHWLWDTTPAGAPPTSHGRIPMNALTIAAGGPGLGKSQYAVWLTARVTRGELPGELFGTPRNVIYAATEDSWSQTIAPRLVAAGADLDRVFHVTVEEDGGRSVRLAVPHHTELLGAEANANDVALMICDPLLSMLDSTVNDYRAAEVRAALEPLVAAAEEYEFTILGLAHFTKSGASDPVDRIAGSGAFGQLIRAMIAFARSEDEDGEVRFVLSQEKNNLGRLGIPSYEYTIQAVTVDTEEGPAYVSRVVFGAETTQTVAQVLRDREEGIQGGTLGEATTWLAGWLTEQDGHATRPEVIAAAKKEGHSERTVERARKALKLRTVRGGFSEPATWWLPEFVGEEWGTGELSGR